jgi:hypothetical protein
VSSVQWVRTVCQICSMKESDKSRRQNSNMDAMEANEMHMDWSEKQRRILTANGMAESWYTPKHGFMFADQELPHHHIKHGNTRKIFKEWKTEEDSCTSRTTNPIVGVWKRSLFYGGFEFSTDHDEYTCNAQTNNLFIDLRIPLTRDKFLVQKASTTIQSLEDLNGEQLCIYARQHVFAGYTKLQKSTSSSNNVLYPYYATRHHCIDWNFVGIPRSRPNKWWVELCGQQMDGDEIKTPVVQQWKEWAFATDPNKQHYYCEHWERWDSSFPTPSDVPMLCLRTDSGRDGILIVLGDHVMYCLDRCNTKLQTSGSCTSLVAVVDEAVKQRNDCDAARAWLSMEGGHGRWITSSPGRENASVGSGSWVLDHCIEFWKQGKPLFGRDDAISVTGTSMEQCSVNWRNESWTVFDCNLSSVEELQNLFLNGPYSVD